MKRSLKYFGLLLLTVLVITGCGKKDPKDQLVDALKKTQKIESAAIKLDGTGSIKASGMTVELSAGAEGEFVLCKDVPAIHAKYNVNAMGQTMNGEAYLIVKDGKGYAYANDGKGWTVEETEFEFDEYTKAIKEFREEKIDASYFKTVKEVKTDKKGYTKLEVTLDAEKLNAKLEEEMKKEEVKEEIGEVNYKLEKDITFTAYLKNGYLAIVEYDLSDIATELYKSFAGAFSTESNSNMPEMEISAKISIELDKQNNTKVEVPEEVTKNAKKTAPVVNNDDPNNA